MMLLVRGGYGKCYNMLSVKGYLYIAPTNQNTPPPGV